MVAHEKRNPAQLFCAVPTQNDLALSSLLFPAQPTQKLGYPAFSPLPLHEKGQSVVFYPPSNPSVSVRACPIRKKKKLRRRAEFLFFVSEIQLTWRPWQP